MACRAKGNRTMTEKQHKFKDLSPEDQKILDWMVGNKRADGTIGYLLKDGPEAVEWLRYYQRKYPHKVPFMLSQLQSEKGEYMVPARWPDWFDRTWVKRESSKTRIFPPKENNSLSPEKRNEIVERALKRYRGTASGRD